MQERTGSTTILHLEAFLPYRLLRAAEEVSRRFARHYKNRHGMTRPEWRTLATIGQFGSITAKQIGEHSSMHKTKVSRAVRALEKRRWLKRRTDDLDRRIEHLELTPPGKTIYRELAYIARVFEQDLVEQLGKSGAHRLDEGLTAIENNLYPEPRR